MRIFDETKTKEITEFDLELGKLVPDKLFVCHHDEIPFQHGRTAKEIAEEFEASGIGIEIGFDGQYRRIIEEHEGGGRFGKLIDDEPDIPAKPAWDEYEDILVYIPYTAAELAEREIEELKGKLSATDYQAIKYAEGEFSTEEYAPIREQRREWRARINELEEIITE